jgi:hypothetical protein
MKEVLQEEKEKSNNRSVRIRSFYQESSKTKERKSKEILAIEAMSPTTSSCEIPILSVLRNFPDMGMPAHTVVREVASSIWFPKLTEDDREARYVHSLRKIVSTTVRWARENLALRGEIHLPGDGCEAGIWIATQKGLARVKEYEGRWLSRYTLHDAVIILDSSKDKSPKRPYASLR